MIDLSIRDLPEMLSINLVRVDGSVIGCLDDIIIEDSASLSIGLNEQCELKFDVKKRADGASEDTPSWYDYINEGMYLWVEKVGLFKVNQPTIVHDGETESKTVEAYSCESELEDKTLTFPINMGTKDSLEYLVEYEDGETENLVNPYTGIPYDWIVIYNTFPEQLTGLSDAYEDGYFGDPDQSGEVVITDEDLIEEFSGIIKLFPRLINKITYVNNPDGSQDSVLTEYVIITYSESDPSVVEQYTLTADFGNRISDLITYYTKYRKQLSLLDIVLDHTGGDWSVGFIQGFDNDDYSLANMKCQFDINESIYSFLTQTLAQTTNCVVRFDIVHRTVNIFRIEDIGNDTGIVMSYDNLINTLNISVDEDRLSTRLKVAGGEDLDITRVNFGSNYVDDITYKINARGSDGKRIYVSDELAEKYMSYIEDRETLRDQYIQLSKDYEKYNEQISEIENRMPNDSLKTDWGTFSLEELQASLTQFKNLMATLTSLYKEDYGTAGVNQDGSIKESFIKNTPYWNDYVAYRDTIVEIQCAIEVFPYYDDTDQWSPSQINEYLEKIKAWETEWTLYGTKELQAKIDTYKQNMDLMLAKYTDDEGAGASKSAVIPVGDTNYISDPETMEEWSHSQNVTIDDGVATFTPNGSISYLDAVVVTPAYVYNGNTRYTFSFEYKSTSARSVSPMVYGIDEESAMRGINWTDEDHIDLPSTDGEWVRYVLPPRTISDEDLNLDNIAIGFIRIKLNDTSGNALNVRGASMNAFSEYDVKTWYMLTPEEQAMYGSSELLYRYDIYIGYYANWVAASEYLSTLLEQISALKELLDEVQSDRRDIVEEVKLENYFTQDECVILHRLFRDADYSNDNILSTSIDSSSEKIDRMVELLEDAKDEASLVSRPQLIFSVESDNILSIPEFKPFIDSFIPGNYILVQYRDNTYVKLRMLGFTFNPCVSNGSGFEIKFSNFVRSRAYYRDWASIFGNSSSSSTSSYGGSGGGSGDGTYGESDDIDVTISNTMLAKLLNTEMFGSRVTDVILDTVDVNKFTARLATFNGLSSGTTTIDGKCITTGYIVSNDYNGNAGNIDNTVGTVINLDSDMFSFAGGKILYDGSNLDIFTDHLLIGSESAATQADLTGKLDTYSVETGTDQNGSILWNGSRLTIQSVGISEDGEGGTIQSTYAVEIGGTGIWFKYNDVSVASIDKDKLVIGKTVVLDEMQVGVERDPETGAATGNSKWSWKFDDSDDSLYLKWIGS